MATILKTLKITSTEIKLWFYAFITLCLFFSPLLFNFIWGNHDWLPIINDNNLSSGLIEGRFSQYLLLNIFLMGKVLPILNTLLGLALYSLAIILLTTRFFKFNTNQQTIIIMATITLPYIIEILYFQFIVLSQLSWPLVIVLSLLAAQKAVVSRYAILYELMCFSLILLAVGGYPPCINLYITAAILQIIKETTVELDFKSLIKKILFYAVPSLCALFLLSLIHLQLKKNDLMLELYNNQQAPLKEYLLKIIPTLHLSLQSFIQPQPFFSLKFKLITVLCLSLSAIIIVIKSSSWQQKLSSVLGIIILLLGIKFAAWLTPSNADNYFSKYDPADFMVRMDFYAIPCLILFSLNILSHSTNLSKNLSYLLSAILILLNMNSCLTFTKTHLLGFNAELKLVDRIITRIQENPAYNSYTLYNITQTGEISLRPRFYQPQTFEKYGYYTLNTPYTRFWIPQEYYNFYLPAQMIKQNAPISPKDIPQDMAAFFDNKISSWPAIDSLYINPQNIIVVLNKEGKELLVNQFRKIKGNTP
ncbi:MAG: glucosyltransferase domain-containing protein [Alphaproteobacteria bacterium]|nr:glucosyltransferase domain-containing protein [Alphaproteobacteria bacterium]